MSQAKMLISKLRYCVIGIISHKYYMDFFLGDWVKIGNKEYCFNSNTLIWNDAKAFCMTEGRKLL